MERLDPGTPIDAEGLRVGGTLGGVLRIEQHVDDAPHGDHYRARFESQPVLVTFIDPVIAAQADVRSWLLRNIARAATVEHRNLLPQHGTFIHGRRCFVVQADPEGQTARQLLHDRAARGKAMDRDTAQTIIGHVCNALAALHQVTVHGNVTLDTVWISGSGRVMVADPGVGALLSRMRRFERMRAQGRLPNVAPEQMLAPPPMSPGTDVFGVATLLLELITGRALAEAGMPMRAMGLHGPDDLVLCLERATAPDVGARPPDIQTFKSELAEAMIGDQPIDLRAPGATPPPPPPPRRAPPSIADPRLHSGLTPATPPHPGVSPPMYPPMYGAPAHAPMAAVLGLPPGVMVPAGFSVVGVPMAGPDGVPTMVPVLIGTPTAAPGPAPAPAVTARARAVATQGGDAMRELDRATRRIASLETNAVQELTEDVSQSSTRLASEPAEIASASASFLRLDVRTAEEAADRLETLDAAASPATVNLIRTPPPSDEAFFPSFASTAAGESHDEPSLIHRGGIALDEDDMEGMPDRYRVQGGRGTEHSVAELVALVHSGALDATDTLIHPLTQRRLNTMEVPELRLALASVSIAPRGRPLHTAPPVAQRPMLVRNSSLFGSTMVWVALSIVAFGAIGVWLWWRANAG